MTAKEMWLKFRSQGGPGTGEYEAWAFGGDPDELASLVLAGKKTATASAYDLYAYDNEELPEPGDYSVILDDNDNAVCVIRNTKVTVVPFRDVDADHARREGEGDLSLEHWRDVHRELFTSWLAEAGLEFSEDMPVVLETFEVVFRP
jgi:uncharacterized protein YhfF